MTFKLELSKDHFTIINTPAETVFSGTVYDYNNIEFKTKGFLHFLQEYLQFEKPAANYLYNSVGEWIDYITLTTKE